MAATTYDVKSEVSKWVNEVFKKYNFKEINVETTGSSEKGDGYVGDIVFVDVQAVTPNGETNTFNLAIKYGKQNEGLREKVPVRLPFEREIFVYHTVVPTLQRFEREHGINILETFMPKCFGTLLYETQEILVFQNLRAIGYELHDRFKPMNMNHLKLTLENYGKWHGLGLAYRDQNPEKCNELFGNLQSVLEAFMPSMEVPIKKSEEGVYEILKSQNETDIMEKLQGRFKQGFVHEFYEFVKMEEDNSVILHGDCWNNNMMFKYDDPDKNQPRALKFLDFQLTKLGSPVLDLAYHIYSTASDGELQHFDELLQVYYSSLSNTIKSLGSNPEKLFPYSELLRQWKKYSSYGMFMALLVLPVALSDKEDALSIEELTEGSMDKMLEKVREKNIAKLSSRYMAILKHFLRFSDS